jgi:hypothetical protein
MKTNSKIILVVSTVVFSAFSALAIPITPVNITLSFPPNGSSVLVNDIDANDLSSFGPGKSVSADLAWLQQDVHWYNLDFAGSLVAPPGENGIAENFSSPITVAAGDYLVLHYGKGPGGNRGGGAVGLYFDASGTYDIPQNGDGANGYGGISYAELFTPSSGTPIPDGGTTALLLGAALTTIGLIRHRLSR